MRMPGMSGANMLSEINKLNPNIISVLLSGYSDIETAKEAIEKGKVYRILTKPYPTEDLITVLNQCIEEGSKEFRTPKRVNFRSKQNASFDFVATNQKDEPMGVCRFG